MLTDELIRLVALSPVDLAETNAAVRELCAQTLRLPPLPAEVPFHDVDPAVREFAEQFSADVSMIDPYRGVFAAALGRKVFGATVLIFVADFVPRVWSGLDALGLAPARQAHRAVEWDHDTDPVDAVLNGFTSAVGSLRGLDPVTTEIVRLRGAVAHNCRLCKSLRESAALEAGGTESLYRDIEHYETSELLTDGHKAALRYVDALIWTPSHITADIAAGVRTHFSDDQAVELTLDVMRNASNKIAVALGGDAPRVAEGTERYLLGADGQPVYA